MKRYLLLSCIFLLAQGAQAQTCNDSIPTSSPDGRFILNGNEVTDTRNGLIWQHCAIGQTGSDCSGGSASTYNWQQALQAAEIERNQTGKLWRVPNINELGSIVEEKCYAPAIDEDYFPSTFGLYWSASPRAGSTSSSGSAWTVYFYEGTPDSLSKSTQVRVRLVRDGQ